MRTWSLGLILCLLAISARAEEKVEELQDAPPLTSSTVKKEQDDTAAAQLLVLGLRADVSFSAGRPTDQGFSLPGLRLNVSGEIARYVDYKVALAPTREVSSALIAQVLPVDAWVQLRDADRGTWKSEASVLWKAGMFAPTLNPSFGVDLADLPFPDYAKTHRAALLFRELGTEITFRPVPGTLDLTAGVFNGSGIVALNTNNAKAFSGAATLHWDLSPEMVLSAGISGYGARQSDSTSVNFISNTVASVYGSLRLGDVTLLSADVVTGRLEDASRSTAVFGFTGTAYVGITQTWRAYFRGEALRYSLASEPKVNRVQIGPAFDPVRGVRIFAYYEHEDDGTSAAETSFQALVRLTL